MVGSVEMKDFVLELCGWTFDPSAWGALCGSYVRPPLLFILPLHLCPSGLFVLLELDNLGQGRKREEVLKRSETQPFIGITQITVLLVLCSHEIKRCLLLGRKVMTNLDSILKIRDITLPAKVCLVKAMVFPVIMYGCESWTVKKAKHRRIDAFELWCWRRLLRVPSTTRRSNQSILKEISPEYSLEGLMLKLKLQ